MAIVQCNRQHYYDDAKDGVCPFCAKENNLPDLYENGNLREQQTVFMGTSSSNDENQLTEYYGELVDEGDKTVYFPSNEMENLFTAGWLVCVKGFAKGKSYTLHRGRNYAGRSMDMDVVLSDDLSISREKHFSVIYDPKSNLFYIVAGSGRTYINGNHLGNDQELFEGDLISAGESEYIFIPFCKVGRIW
ncbi:MAG: FHA domain-containing protein [Oscillospiraceae bacterium]|nr:FHA domain-containing protein [Oscillospiraceae bacterium]